MDYMVIGNGGAAEYRMHALYLWLVLSQTFMDLSWTDTSGSNARDSAELLVSTTENLELEGRSLGPARARAASRPGYGPTPAEYESFESS
jgi:hypothetical protein